MNRLYQILAKNKKYLVYIPLGIYWLILLTLTSLPTVDFVDVLRFSDKIKHYFAYLVLSFLVTLAAHFQEKFRLTEKQVVYATIAFTTIYGIIDELHQALIPGRSCSGLDLAADVAGILTGTLAAFYFIIKRRTSVST